MALTLPIFLNYLAQMSYCAEEKIPTKGEFLLITFKKLF